jgi:hypothetical protein
MITLEAHNQNTVVNAEANTRFTRELGWFNSKNSFEKKKTRPRNAPTKIVPAIK